MTRRELVKKEGILVGGSSGAAIWAARQVAREIDRPDRIVRIFPDSAFRYLTTIFNDEWMKEKGFL